MNEPEIDLLPYRTKSGKEPFTIWINKLSESNRGRVRARLNLLRLLDTLEIQNRLEMAFENLDSLSLPVFVSISEGMGKKSLFFLSVARRTRKNQTS